MNHNTIITSSTGAARVSERVALRMIASVYQLVVDLPSCKRWLS